MFTGRASQELNGYRCIPRGVVLQHALEGLQETHILTGIPQRRHMFYRPGHTNKCPLRTSKCCWRLRKIDSNASTCIDRST